MVIGWKAKNSNRMPTHAYLKLKANPAMKNGPEMEEMAGACIPSREESGFLTARVSSHYIDVSFDLLGMVVSFANL